MPKKTTSITTNISDPSTILALALGTFIRLGWNPKYSNERIIIGYTPRKWNKWDDEITIEATPNQLTITSKLIHNESFDLLGKNKKHIAEYLSAFEAVKASATDIEIENWKSQLAKIGAETIQAAEKEITNAAEIDKVMNFSKSNLYVTYGLIAINTLIFIAMVFSGINFFAPAPLDVLKWGGNYTILTFSGEWWRLFTSVFLHFGILHLLLNMYALYFIGSYLEPLLGKARFIVAYICAGVAASLVSVLWHQGDNSAVSAGASGAIFGMFGLFLSLLITNVVPKQVKNSILQSVLFFVAFNVFYGFKSNSGIDNSAHLGGLFSGMIIGFAYYLSFRKPTTQKRTIITSLVAVGTFAVVFMVLKEKQAPPVYMDLKTGNVYKEGEKEAIEKFSNSLDIFYTLQDESLNITSNSALSSEEYLVKLKDTVLVNWNKGVSLMKEAESPSLSARGESLRKDYQHYAELRVEETNLFIKATEENTVKYTNTIDSIQKEIRIVTERINQPNTDK